jgi:hypothetical protein
MHSDALLDLWMKSERLVPVCPETCILKNNFARKVTRLLKRGQAHFHRFAASSASFLLMRRGVG